MSEQLDPSLSAENEPTYDAIKQIEELEQVFNYLKDECKAIAQVSYSSLAEAKGAVCAIEAMFEEKGNKHPNMTYVPLRVSGEGVDEVAIGANPSLEDIFAIDQDDPYTPVDPSDSRVFYFESWNYGVQEVAPDDWRVEICLYGNKLVIPKTLFTPKGESFLKCGFQPMIRIGCKDNNAQIESVGLADRRERKRALADLSKLTTGDEQKVVIGLLQELTYAIEAINPDCLVGVEDIRMLHAFGEIGAQFAREDIRKADALATAITAFIGKDHSIRLDGTGYVLDGDDPLTRQVIEGLYGEMKTILPDIPMSAIVGGQPVGLTFIISDNGTMYAMPFTALATMAM
jgi:hypothetical protein